MTNQYSIACESSTVYGLMVELVDTTDLKSVGQCVRMGSSPI